MMPDTNVLRVDESDLVEPRSAGPRARSATAPSRSPAKGGASEAVLDIVSMDRIAPEALQWLWPGRIALGKLTLLMGDPGAGKSVLTIDMAAHVSLGRAWPDETPCPLGDVMIFSAEDDPADTIRPRLDAAGAEVRRVHFIRGIRAGETSKPFDLVNQNLDLLARTLGEFPDAKLLIIDPITAYLGGTDSHINAAVRELLAPLADIARKHGLTILAVTHMNKTAGGNAMYRAMGSLAFIAAARGAYVVAKDKNDLDRRLFLPVKNNLARDEGGLAFRLDQAHNHAPVVTWEQGRVDISADDALQPPELPQVKRIAKKDTAEAWLRDRMTSGSVPSKEIGVMAEQEGISSSTLQRAKKKLGIRSDRDGKDWYLRPPEQPASDTRH